MKIAFIISNFMQGGIETYILRFLKEYKHKIELIVISNSKLCKLCIIIGIYINYQPMSYPLRSLL